MLRRQKDHFDQEYTWTLEGRWVPKCAWDSNPCYSDEAKKQTKDLIKQGEEYCCLMSSEVKTYKLTAEEIKKLSSIKGME